MSKSDVPQKSRINSSPIFFSLNKKHASYIIFNIYNLPVLKKKAPSVNSKLHCISKEIIFFLSLGRYRTIFRVNDLEFKRMITLLIYSIANLSPLPTNTLSLPE